MLTDTPRCRPSGCILQFLTPPTPPQDCHLNNFYQQQRRSNGNTNIFGPLHLLHTEASHQHRFRAPTRLPAPSTECKLPAEHLQPPERLQLAAGPAAHRAERTEAPTTRARLPQSSPLYSLPQPLRFDSSIDFSNQHQIASYLLLSSPLPPPSRSPSGFFGGYCPFPGSCLINPPSRKLSCPI